MASEFADRFCANELRANNKITLRERDIDDLITDASQFTIAAAAGPGYSLLSNGGASQTGTGTTIPVVLRNLIPGLNTTFTDTPTGIQINTSPTGVATLIDGPNPATSLIYDSAGVLKTVQVANSLTLSTATAGRLIFGLALTNTGGGASLLQNTGGQFKTVAVSSAVTMSDVAGLVTFGLNLTTTGGATSILSTAGGVFKTLGADAAVTISTTTPGQVRFGLNLAEVGGGISILNSPSGIIRTLTGSSGLVVSNPNANTVDFATNLTDSGADQSLIRNPNAVLYQLATSGAVTMAPDGASGPIRFGLALTSVGTGTQLYSNANGVFRAVAAGSGVSISVVSDAIQISANGVLSLSNASGSGVSLVFASTGAIKTLIQGTGITIADSPSGSVTLSNSGVIQVQSIGSGSSLINASTGTIKSVVQGTGITVNATSTELTITNSGVVALSSTGSGTSLVNNSNGELKSLDATRGFTIADSGGTMTVTPPLGGNNQHYLKWDTGSSSWVTAPLQQGVRLTPDGPSGGQQYLYSAAGGTSWSAITLVSGGVGAGSVLPSTGAAGQVLTSDGTSWSSQSPSVESAQLLLLSAFGQSDYITSALTTRFPSTVHIWYNKAAVASGVSLFVNSGDIVRALEITMTTKSTMPVWPAYLWADSGGGISNLNDMPFFMLPPPGTTKTYIRYMTQGFASRNTSAGTYTSLWDNTTTNVFGSSTAVSSPVGGTGSFWGVVWTLGILDVNGIVENYDSLAVGGINLLTSPASSAYFSAIQIRGRY